MKTFPEADVIWWNAKDYRIQCPFCDGVHRHGINWKTKNLRLSHCEKREIYLCCFPMNDQGEVAYEIDKRRGRYKNICVSHGSDTEDGDDVNHLATKLAQKATIAARRAETHPSILEDSKEGFKHDLGHGIEPFEGKKIAEVISECVTGNVKVVQDYLNTSGEAQLFIRGRYPDGRTTLIMAAAEQSSRMLLLLIEHRAEVNAVDNRGTTALMEAALFGRVDNVKILLEHSADKDTRDDENRLAIDFAQDNPRNRRERYCRAGGDLTSSSNKRPLYVEDTVRRDIDRQEIVRLLGGKDRKSMITLRRPSTLLLSNSYSFKPSPMQDSLVLYGPIEEYPISSIWKTVARLERGGKFPSVGAMSGWSHCPVQSLTVEGQQWTDDVLYISEVTDHRLPSHRYDQGKDVQYNACHAEKQLIAYFIDRHVFLPRDSLPDSKLEKDTELKEDEIHEFVSSTETGRQMTSLRKKKMDLKNQLLDWDEKLVGKHDEIKALELELRSVKRDLDGLIASPRARPLLELEIQLEALYEKLRRRTDLIDMANTPPPVSLTEGVILISSPPCQDCNMFKDRVNEFFGLSIELIAAA